MERIVEIAVLAACVLPVVRFAVKGPVRRELREHRAYALCVAIIASSCLALVAWASVYSVSTLRALTIGCVVLVALAYLRARPSYGVSRGLPQGSLGLTASIDSIDDERYYAREAAMWGPVFKMSQNHKPVVCIVDLALGFEFLERNKDSLGQSALPFARLIEGSYVEFMNGEQHERFRGMLRPALIGPVIKDWEPYLVRTVARQLDRVAGLCGEKGVKPDQVLDDIAFIGLLRLFFGISAEHERFARFQDLYTRIDFRSASYTHVPVSLKNAFEESTTEIYALIDELRRDPPGPGGRSVLSEILRSIPESDREGETRTLVGNLIFIMAVARDDLEGFLLWILKMSCDHPQWALDLRPCGAAGTVDAARMDRLSMNIVKETLRLRQSEYVYRDVLRECRIGKYRIPKGWRVRLCLTECHRLESVFSDPDAFDPGRFAERTYTKSEYCPFSDGGHACFGVRVATTIGLAFLQGLATGFDWETASDGPVERGNRQWNHWKPNSEFRVSLTRHLPDQLRQHI